MFESLTAEILRVQDRCQVASPINAPAREKYDNLSENLVVGTIAIAPWLCIQRRAQPTVH